MKRIIKSFFIKMPVIRILLWNGVIIGMLLALTSPAYTITLQLPDPPAIPTQLPREKKEALKATQIKLIKEKKGLVADAEKFNEAVSSPVPADRAKYYQDWSDRLQRQTKSYQEKVRKLGEDIEQVVTSELRRIEESMAQFPPAAGALINMMNSASQKMKLPKGGSHANQSLNCSNFFRNLGEQLRKGGKPANGKEWTSPNFAANDIINEIANNKTEWKKVSENEVQNLANIGMVVVGLQKGASHGHIAFAVPIPPGLNPANFKGEGPFIRDGNEHLLTKTERRLYATTWGAAKASKAFSKDPNNPLTWYIWRPSHE